MDRDPIRTDRSNRVIREDVRVDDARIEERPVVREERTMPPTDAFADEARPIDLVREGMNVIDASGDKIGTVEYVKSGNPDAATADEFEYDGGLIEDFARVFGYEDEPHVPSPLHERFIRRGYIKIDADGLFATDRYIAADAIEKVSADTVWLNARREQMAEEQ